MPPKSEFQVRNLSLCITYIKICILHCLVPTSPCFWVIKLVEPTVLCDIYLYTRCYADFKRKLSQLTVLTTPNGGVHRVFVLLHRPTYAVLTNFYTANRGLILFFQCLPCLTFGELLTLQVCFVFCVGGGCLFFCWNVYVSLPSCHPLSRSVPTSQSSREDIYCAITYNNNKDKVRKKILCVTFFFS